MSALFYFNVPLVIGIPALLIWLWRARFIPKNYSGMRLENHRSQLWHSSKPILSVWGLTVLITVDEIIRSHPVSRDFRQFWRGFYSASDLFLMGFIVVNMLPFLQQLRDKRQQRLLGNTTTRVN